MRTIRSAVVCLSFIVLLGASASLKAQGTRSDYERARGLREMTENKVFKTRVKPHWFADNTRFWYRNDLPAKASEFILVEAVKGSRGPAFDHARLAASLSEKTGKEYTATHLPMEEIEFLESENAIRFRAEGKRWKCDLGDYSLVEVESTLFEKFKELLSLRGPTKGEGKKGRPIRNSRSPRRRESPDGKWVAFFEDHSVCLRNLEDGEEFALSADGNAEDEYSGRVFWSPDSKKLVALRTKKGDNRKVYFIESSPKDQIQPRLHSFPYPKPGDRIPIPGPQLFDVTARKQIPMSNELFSNPWNVSDFQWESDSRRFTFLYNQRGHQVLRVIAVDADTGDARAIVDEEGETFVDYAHKQFMHHLGDTREIIWMSERDGWNHLYLYDADTGRVKNQVTKGEWVVRGVDRVDEQKRQIWFRAGSIRPGQEPYYIHYCRVNFDGSGLLLLTEGDGTHSIEYSPDQRFFIDTWSRVDMPPVTELRRSEDSKLVCELEKADWSELLKTGWQAPERFVAKGRDGETDIYGVIYRPTNFDPSKNYPVIEDIYAGPQDSFVPKAFRSCHRPQAMAELGFILVQIDGMGTSNRSKKFHDVCWKNLGDSGFPDRILWIKAAGAKYPSMDITRVGIYGGSAGGQSSLRALLAHGDFYKVAVSDCGCHDNRMDKIWWNELWMSWPVGPHYEEQSNVTQAHKLEGKLLLIVGEMDKNVDPASTMQVVNALIKADKDFDLLVMPGVGHGAAGTPYGRRRLEDFFVRHLLGVEPRRQP